ncbi:MAG: hypothetical protein EBW55_04215 [Betaproteobacteria bacterium]|nr:hypothetical protein [Betaproteobacteria bacterium]
MSDNKNDLPHFVGIDVGTTAVRCVVGAVNQAGEPEIIGYGISENQGMRKGVVTHPDEVTNAIIAAINEAERHSLPEVSGVEALEFLMTQHGLKQSDLTGIGSQGVVSEILTGKRDLNLRPALALSARFGLSTATFV